VDTAAQAPRAAAEVIAELRQQLSASMARDNAQLDERARLLQTLDTLLGAVTQAAQEQRGAIDALVASSAQTLEPPSPASARPWPPRPIRWARWPRS
jgi:hypothetical protein